MNIIFMETRNKDKIPLFLFEQRVFLTGGNMMYPNLKERIEKELMAIRPFQSTFQVIKAGKICLPLAMSLYKMSWPGNVTQCSCVSCCVQSLLRMSKTSNPQKQKKRREQTNMWYYYPRHSDRVSSL